MQRHSCVPLTCYIYKLRARNEAILFNDLCTDHGTAAFKSLVLFFVTQCLKRCVRVRPQTDD